MKQSAAAQSIRLCSMGINVHAEYNIIMFEVVDKSSSQATSLLVNTAYF